MQCILIVEDRESMAGMLKATLEGEGFRAVTAGDATLALKKLKEERIDLVLTDLKLPGKNGIEVLRASREDDALRPVIVMTAYGSIEGAVQAMRLGAYDFITKPFDTEHLTLLIKRALENQRMVTENILLKEELGHKFMPVIIGKSPSIEDVAQKLRRVAPVKSTVLLLGESGTGKELFARAIHSLSPRSGYAFVAINCAAIPDKLLETELFGYEKGAFTGADRTKPGKLELAHMGTVFLDEVGELDLSLQAKLLRVLQEGEIERVGGAGPIKIDVRVVAASNKDIEKEVQEKKFREDLYYRLNVFPISIPPLRKRRDDIPLLASYFVTKYASEIKSGEKKISPEALLALSEGYWKGNVRELENTIERAVILCDGDTIKPEHLCLNPCAPPEEPLNPDGPLEEISRQAQKTAETERIRHALAASKGNKTRAAEALKVSYKTLLTKIKEYGLE
ncbi:MAG: sigma-54 dependent transcriptional regulator [Nitrospiraceae bacterium]|nr:sigma-54 dependent transcriptional regulator [Nitrospiraceae bacterium]